MTRILTIIALLFATPAWAENAEIIAADDLHRVFAMSQTEWDANALSVEAAGLGRVGGEDALHPSSLTIFSDSGAVETAPFYFSDKNQPAVVFVRIGILQNEFITKESLSKIQELTEKQLSAAHFKVNTGRVDQIPDGYWLTFAIRKSEQK